MSRLIITCVFAVLFAQGVIADETSPPTTYNVSLTELTESLLPTMTHAEIIEKLTQQGADAGIKTTDIIRLSVLDGVKSIVQFGRMSTVTTGRILTGNRQQRVAQSVQLGSLLNTTAQTTADGVMLQLNYESSRLDGDGTEDSPPDTVITKIETTQLMKLDTPRLFSGTSGDRTKYTIVIVSKQ